VFVKLVVHEPDTTSKKPLQNNSGNGF